MSRNGPTKGASLRLNTPSVIVISNSEIQRGNILAGMYSNFGVGHTYLIAETTIHLPPICIVGYKFKAKKISKL